MFRQTLSREEGLGQLCGEPASSVCAPASGVAVWTESAGGLLGQRSEEQLTILIVIWDSSFLPTWLGEEMGESGEETLARSCTWSWSEPDSMLTLLHNSHRLCRVSSRFCSSSVLSCNSRSSWLFCRANDSNNHLQSSNSNKNLQLKIAVKLKGHSMEIRKISSQASLFFVCFFIRASYPFIYVPSVFKIHTFSGSACWICKSVVHPSTGATEFTPR